MTKDDERFNVHPRLVYRDIQAEVLKDGLCRHIELQVDNVLTVDEARELRDWLNEVLP